MIKLSNTALKFALAASITAEVIGASICIAEMPEPSSPCKVPTTAPAPARNNTATDAGLLLMSVSAATALLTVRTLARRGVLRS